MIYAQAPSGKCVKYQLTYFFRHFQISLYLGNYNIINLYFKILETKLSQCKCVVWKLMASPTLRLAVRLTDVCWNRFEKQRRILLNGNSGGHFKNTYELLNPRALKISMLYTNRIFQCMGKIFCVEFQRFPLKFHTKYLIHRLKDMIFIQH